MAFSLGPLSNILRQSLQAKILGHCDGININPYINCPFYVWGACRMAMEFTFAITGRFSQ